MFLYGLHSPINPQQLGWQLSFLGDTVGSRLLPARRPNRPGRRDLKPAGGFRSLSPHFCVSGSCCLSPASRIPQPPLSSPTWPSKAHSQGGLHWLSRVCAPILMSPVTGASAGHQGRGLGCGFPAQLAFEVSQKPSLRPSPVHTLFLLGCFFPVQDHSKAKPRLIGSARCPALSTWGN